MRGVSNYALQVCARIKYYDRVVNTGGEHYNPAMQEISPLVAKLTPWKSFVVVEPNEMAPNFWGIVDPTSGSFLQIVKVDGPATLAFVDPLQADAARRWMIAQASRRIGHDTIQLPDIAGPQAPLDWSKLRVSPILQPARAVPPDDARCKALPVADDTTP